MKSTCFVSAIAIAGLTVLSTSASALESTIDDNRTVHPIDGPADAGNGSGSRTGSDACPATNLGTLSDGDTIVGSTTGLANDFVIGCGGFGGPDAIFEFSVDSPGGWSFDTCTIPACWDTTLEIREETGGGCPGDFVSCDSDGCSVCYYESLLRTFLAPSATYYLIVDGWSSYAYGDFEVTVHHPVICDCAVDADCDDGVFCNGREICDPIHCCVPDSAPPCTTYEGYVAPCDVDLDVCTELDPCFTWIAGATSGYFYPQAINCANRASWVFDDVQGSHHTTGLLDFYTTPIVARTTPNGASPLGTSFSVEQALFSVEAGTCNPDAQIAGSQCTGTATIDPVGSPLQDLPCSGTMPLLPNNAGNFNVCEIDFYLAYRTTENGAGMSIAGETPLLGGPAGGNDFGETVIWLETCPPPGLYEPFAFGGQLTSDFANAQVCQKPGGTCCAPDGSCSLTSESNCAAVGGTYGGTGTINNDPGACDDPDGDGIYTPCGDNCPDDFNPDQEDCDRDGEGDACDEICVPGACCLDNTCFNAVELDCLDAGGTFVGINTACLAPDEDDDGDGLRDECDGCPNDPNKVEPGICGCGKDDTADSDGDGVVDCFDLCPGSDDFAPGAFGDTDSDGVVNCNDLCPGVDDAVFGDCTGTIPTVSVWGLMILALLLLAGSKVVFRGRSRRYPIA